MSYESKTQRFNLLMHKLLVCETKIICHTLQWVLYISYFDNTKLSSQSSHFKGTLNSIFTIMDYQNCGLAFDFLENRFSEVTCADWSWPFKHAFLYLLYTVSHRRANKLNWLMLFLSLAIWRVFQISINVTKTGTKNVLAEFIFNLIYHTIQKLARRRVQENW